MGVGIVGKVAQEGDTLNIREAWSDPRFNPDVDKKTGYKTRSILCAPIISQGIIIGALQVINKLGGVPFTALDEATAKGEAGSIGKRKLTR